MSPWAGAVEVAAAASTAASVQRITGERDIGGSWVAVEGRDGVQDSPPGGEGNAPAAQRISCAERSPHAPREDYVPHATADGSRHRITANGTRYALGGRENKSRLLPGRYLGDTLH